MSETRDMRCKRLQHRSRYRGTKESDLLFGQFAANYLASLDDVQLGRYEALLDEPDQDRSGLDLRSLASPHPTRSRCVRAPACVRADGVILLDNEMAIAAPTEGPATPDKGKSGATLLAHAVEGLEALYLASRLSRGTQRPSCMSPVTAGG